MADKIRVVVLGASGYSGWELVRLLERHPGVELVATAANSEAGKTLQDLDPQARQHPLLSVEAALDLKFDACFAALPHGVSQQVVAAVYDQGRTVIDLSADFRLNSPEVYERHYGVPHGRPDLLNEAVYGLTEWNRQSLSRGRLVANPGCYPTCVLLPLGPWARRGWLAGAHIIADCKSGVSGAGRSAKIGSLYVEVNENLSPYQLGNVHRHTVEMEQELADLGLGFELARLTFSPHLVPLSRGMLGTLYVPWPDGVTESELRHALEQDYHQEPFVRVLAAGQTASVAHTSRTNLCAISLHPVVERKILILVSSIDNLLKGAAGQAVQNFNRVYGFPETTSLAPLVGSPGSPTRPPEGGTA